MAQTRQKITAALLALLLIFVSGCSSAPEAGGFDGAVATGSIGQDLRTGYAADNVFSLKCNFSSPANPLTTRSEDNQLVGELVYETLFTIGDDFTWDYGLVTEFEATGGTWWVFTIDPARRFSDGSALTAEDCAYSLKLARTSPKYASRLSLIYGVSALSETQFAVSTAYANSQFPVLLSIPVVKKNSAVRERPLGTGMYQYSEDGASLVGNPYNPSAESLPLSTIYLKEYTEVEDSIAAFEDSLIDLVLNDPTGVNDYGYGSANEIRYYPTSNMHYLGINQESRFLQYATYRYALNFAVDRAYIVEELLGGDAVPATLPMAPSSALYDADYAEKLHYSMEKCLQVLSNGNVRDHDDDGKLEYVVTGINIEININFIVCSDSTPKVEAARMIAEGLRGIGVDVTLRELDWNDYMKALEEGDFDIYYGEVLLTPDWNLIEMFREEGGLNYCKVKDATYTDYIYQYLEASDELRRQCADSMCRYIAETAAIIPICFEKQEVITHRGAVSGIDANQYGVFRNFENWKINLG